MELKIEYININEIKLYEKNPRNNDNAVDYVANSIKEFGFKVPIVIDKNNVIVAGHTRLKASKKLGLKEVPCIVATDLTEKQIKAFRIAENKTNELAGWNDNLLSNEIKELFEDIDMTDFGFGDFEISMLIDDFEPEKFDNEMINEYSKRADDIILKAGRIIITYDKPEEKAFLEELIKEKKDCLKVIYKCKDIISRLEN